MAWSARSLLVSLALVALAACQGGSEGTLGAPRQGLAETKLALSGPSGQWQSFATEARSLYAGVELGDGSALVCGGWDGSIAQNSVLTCSRFSFDGDLQKQTFPLPEARRHATLTLVPPNRVLLAGGMDSNGNALTARLSSPLPWADNQTIWGAPEGNADSPSPRSAHTATRLDSSIVLIGGEAGIAQVSTIDVRSDAGTWTKVEPSSGLATRVEHSATLLKSQPGNAARVLILGGVSQSQGGYLSSGFVFSLPNQITPIPDMPAARAGHTATLLDDGSVLVAGGRGIGEALQAAAWRYFPDAKHWESAGSIVPRKYHAASRLGTDVLVAGGVANVGVNNAFATLGGLNDAPSNADTVQRYSFAKNAWFAAPNLIRGRRDFQLLSLDATHLLAAGGGIDLGALFNSEVFSAGTLGEAATNPLSCASGFIADGVCCDTACEGSCRWCNDPTAPGTCKLVNGPAPNQNGCGDSHLQCTAGACALHCAGNNSCEVGYFCGSDANCHELKPIGKECSAKSECANGAPCVDGVCCESACSGSCEACNQPDRPGLCRPLAKGDMPQDGHPSCASAGDDECAASCDGRTRDRCVFPAAGSSCGDSATCTADGFQPPQECDGHGTCKATLVSCSPYVCGQKSGQIGCLNSCIGDSQCAEAEGYHCNNGACTHCDVAECRAQGYTCSDAGECRNRCEVSERDCAGGYYCHPLQHLCVKAVAFPAASLPGCGIGHEPSRSPTSMLALMSLLCAATARYTRRANRRRVN